MGQVFLVLAGSPESIAEAPRESSEEELVEYETEEEEEERENIL